jgi:hypothetical protein
MGAPEGCRIGGQNESAHRFAQQGGRVIQITTLAPLLPGAGVALTPAARGSDAETKNPYPSLR